MNKHPYYQFWLQQLNLALADLHDAPPLVIRTVKPTRAVEVMRDTTAGVEPDFKFRRRK